MPLIPAERGERCRVAAVHSLTSPNAHLGQTRRPPDVGFETEAAVAGRTSDAVCQNQTWGSARRMSAKARTERVNMEKVASYDTGCSAAGSLQCRTGMVLARGLDPKAHQTQALTHMGWEAL